MERNTQRIQEIESEKRLLLKAETDIEDGWIRLRDQEEALASLRASGNDVKEAERLVQLLKSTLIEWERHRALIEQRIIYLQGKESEGKSE